jgi:hypothetical protein
MKFARLSTLDNIEYWEMPEYPKIDPAPDDRRYIVDRNDRADRLANDFYGSSDLWWIITLANGIDLIPNGLYEGQVITVPSARRVFSQILRRPSRGLEGR